MLNYILGALAGGVFGYFILYRMIGCSGGSCPITANPYTSIIYGIVIGLLLVSVVASPKKADKTDVSEDSQATIATTLAKAAYQRLTAEEAKMRIDSGDDIVILDVRTESEFKSGHIEDAILLPNENIKNTPLEQLPDLDAEILIYCRSGNRSEQAARKLIKIGYTNVYDFGGINSWPYETVVP